MLVIHFDNFLNWGNQDITIIKGLVEASNRYDGKQQQATNSMFTELIPRSKPHTPTS